MPQVTTEMNLHFVRAKKPLKAISTNKGLKTHSSPTTENSMTSILISAMGGLSGISLDRLTWIITSYLFDRFVM